MNKCIICKKETKNKKYCGFNCRSIGRKNNTKYKNEIRKCILCNKEFIVISNSKKKYCSTKCANNDPKINEIKIATMKQTKLKKYGDENYVNVEKMKQTNLQKYGVENFFQTNEFKNKSKQTLKNKYDVEFAQQSKYIKDKTKKSVIEKYGGFTLESDILKNKVIQTNIKKYNVANVMSNKDIQQKVKNTNLKKYGVEWVLSNKDIQQKIKNTNIVKYGATNISKVKQIQDIKRKTINSKFYTSLFENRLKNSITPLFSFNDYTGVEYYKKYKFKCNVCKTEFYDILYGGHIPRCLKCNPIKSNTSKYENEITDFIKQVNKNIKIIKNNKKIIYPFELDIYLPEYNLAIEFNGLYWHSEISGGKNKKYHLNKTQLCNKKNIKLLHIWDSEWIQNKTLIKSIILNNLNKSKNIVYGRKCYIKEIKTNIKNDFLNINHLQKADKSSIKLGLYYNDNLISVMTFVKSRFDKNIEWEMSRYATKINYLVIGGMNKLFSYFIKKYNPQSIVSYCDLRFFDGKSYEKLSFIKSAITSPSYFYTDYKNVYNRINFQKHKLKNKLKIYDESLSEWELMKVNGYDRIWNCGNYKYVWYNKKSII